MSRELDVSLHPAQLEIFNSKARFKVVSAGRRLVNLGWQLGY